MVQDNTTNSGVRSEAIAYITEQFSEIFEVSESDKGIIENNLTKMDDEGLRRELELLNDYYYNTRQAYTNGLSHLRELSEQEEKRAEEVHFNF